MFDDLHIKVLITICCRKSIGASGTNGANRGPLGQDKITLSIAMLGYTDLGV